LPKAERALKKGRIRLVLCSLTSNQRFRLPRCVLTLLPLDTHTHTHRDMGWSQQRKERMKKKRKKSETKHRTTPSVHLLGTFDPLTVAIELVPTINREERYRGDGGFTNTVLDKRSLVQPARLDRGYVPSSSIDVRPKKHKLFSIRVVARIANGFWRPPFKGHPARVLSI
jgi:hypothetical protein